MYIIVKRIEPEVATTCGEMCGDYHINYEGKLYLCSVIRHLYTEITEYDFRAKKFKTKKAAEKALDLRCGFSADENKTLRAEGYEVVEI